MANNRSNRTKSKLVNFRVAPADYERIKRKAASADMGIGAYLRTTALTGNVTIIPGMTEAAGQLHRIGVNLNQLTRSANEGRIQCVDLRETKQEVGKVWQFLNSQTPRVL